MTGYRLSFLTNNPNLSGHADALIEAQDTLGDVVGPIAELGEILSNNYLTSAHGVIQFVIRFEAPDDRTALVAADAALRSVRKPLDSVKIEKRGRRYVEVA